MRTKLTLLALILVGSVSAQTFTNYTTTDGLLNDNVNCLDVASSDVLWFGTQSGVSVFDGVNWVGHTNATDPGLVDDNVLAIRVMSNGDVWVGTDFGACHFDGNSWTTYTTADGLGNNQIKCIEEDASGNVWFGTNNGASYYDGNTWMNLGTADGLPFGGVTAINIDGNGDVWLGSGLGGIAIYNGTIGTMITEANTGLVDDRIRGLRNDANGNRWVGTSEGITVLDGSNNNIGYHTQMYTLSAPDTLNPIEDVEIDNSGNVWVGVYVDYLVTEGGVCAFDGNSWTEYHVSDGLVGPVVRALAIDSQNDIWVATSSGVSRISDHAVSVAENNSESFSMYPNPASDVITIAYPENSMEGEVYIFNASMQLIEMLEFNNGAKKISYDISHFSSGIYFIRTNGHLKKLIID